MVAVNATAYERPLAVEIGAFDSGYCRESAAYPVAWQRRHPHVQFAMAHAKR